MRIYKIGLLLVSALLAGCGGGGGGTNPTTNVVTTTAAAVPTATTTSVVPTPPAIVLGAVTHFSQGWDTSILAAAQSLGISRFRDEISWNDVEAARGVYEFNTERTTYPDRLVANGIKVTLLFQGGNRHYDGGHTPYTDAGRAAFAAFIVKTLDRFPGVDTIEIGNEYNSSDFVTGPVAAASYGERQRYYAAMLRAVYSAVKTAHPRVRILGGAAHSIPVGYLKQLFAEGALNSMDAVVIHPYTTIPEDLAKQIDVLKGAMGANSKPIVVTEFATEIDSARDTASYLVKAVSQLAAAGVAEADWYALRQEGTPENIWYKNAGLLTFAGIPTAAGRAMQLMQQRVIPLGAARRLATDDTSFAIGFGNRAMVLWGEPRSLTVTAAARFYDVEGQAIAPPSAINASEPIIVVSDEPLILNETVRLGATRLLADTLYQFNHSNDGSGPWTYLIRQMAKGTIEPALPQGGGEVASSAWTPYLGNDYLRPFMIAATAVNPADFGTAGAPNVFKPVMRYTSSTSGRVDIAAEFVVTTRSVDGIDLTITINGRPVFIDAFGGRRQIALNDLIVNAGDQIDFAVGINRSISGGDDTTYRIRITAD